MCDMCCHVHFSSNDDCPMYEVPCEKYPAETVNKILLNPKMDQSKICHKRPLDITKSSTYLNCLKDPDDVKKDNFGVWKHVGSRNQQFECSISDNKVYVGCGVLSGERKWEQYSLCRLHSKHPSNENFRRMICFITGGCVHFCILC